MTFHVNSSLTSRLARYLWAGVFLIGVAVGGAKPGFAEQYKVFMARIVAQGEAQHMFQPALEARLQALINAYRLQQGRPALGEDPALKAAARAHAADMAMHDRLGHVASTGHDFESRMRALRPGVMVLPAMGENAAAAPAQTANVEEVAQVLFKAWLKSPPHLHTLVSRDYLRSAMGVAIFGGKAYADQIFIGPEVQTNLNAGSAN